MVFVLQSAAVQATPHDLCIVVVVVVELHSLTATCAFACACNRAEQHGVAEAAALLSLLEPSCEVAARKMRASAEAGDPVACFMLAQAYFEGLHGCEK